MRLPRRGFLEYPTFNGRYTKGLIAIASDWGKPLDACSFQHGWVVGYLIYYIELSSYVIHKNG